MREGEAEHVGGAERAQLVEDRVYGADIRREVTHCELLTDVQALLTATGDFLDRYNRRADAGRAILGATRVCS